MWKSGKCLNGLIVFPCIPPLFYVARPPNDTYSQERLITCLIRLFIAVPEYNVVLVWNVVITDFLVYESAVY